jgi:CRP/FNR family transcriptional regulator, cyclic AMP receptor protein
MGSFDRRRERRRYRLRGADVTVTSASAHLLVRLAEDDREEFVRAGHGLRVPGGKIVSTAGDDTLVVVLRGVAASRSSTASGEIVIRDLLEPGDTHGLTFALGHHEIAEDLVAVTDVEALAVPGAALRGLVDRAPQTARACLVVLAERYAAAQGELIRFTGSSAAVRVEYRLIELAERFGVADRGRIVVTLPLTQDALASWARTSRETCAKTLFELRHAGILTTGRRQLVIEDLAALRARRRGSDPTVDALLHGLSRSGRRPASPSSPQGRLRRSAPATSRPDHRDDRRN